MLMSDHFRRPARLLAAMLIAASLAGCASSGHQVGELIPQWAGGLPADAPPPPGTARYDAFMAERERRRQMPAAERDKLPPIGSDATSAPAPAPTPAPTPAR